MEFLFIFILVGVPLIAIPLPLLKPATYVWVSKYDPEVKYADGRLQKIVKDDGKCGGCDARFPVASDEVRKCIACGTYNASYNPGCRTFWSPGSQINSISDALRDGGVIAAKEYGRIMHK